MVITGGWCITCHGSTAQQQSAFTLEYLVSYCRSVRHDPTLKMRVVLFLGCIKNSTISSKHVHCCIHVSRFVLFLLRCCPILYQVRTYLVPGMCRVILCPILYVRTWYHTAVLRCCPILYQVRTYLVPGMCRVILCPILYVRTWYHTAVFACDNNSVLTTLH